MSAEHKRPLLAFALVAIACLLILANALRTEALRGYLKDGASRLAAGVELALDHPSIPQPVVAPPVAAAPFDRLEPAVPSSRPTPASAPATSAPAALPATPPTTVAPPAPSVPSVGASVEKTARLARAVVARPVHRVAHRVHRAAHRITHRAGHRVHRVHRAGHAATSGAVTQATHRIGQRATTALPRPLVRGHHRALGHRDVRGVARWALHDAPGHSSAHGRGHDGTHGRGHDGTHGRGHHGTPRHGHPVKRHGHSGRR